MTEHTRIPLPPEDGSEPGATPGSQPRSGSLIERAVTAFDLGRFSPPPVPGNLAPPVPKPAVRHRQPRAEAPVAAPVASAAPPAPAFAPPAAAAPAAEPTAAAPPVAAQAAPVPPAAPAPQPAVFAGKRYAVDRQHLHDLGMIVPEGSVTALLEEFRIVKRQILLQAADLRRQGAGAAAQRVLISSPHPDEGKTYCAVNLALSIAAEKESEVLLVDADFAKPSVLSTLGLPGGPGLMDALTNPGADVADYVIGTDIPGLWVLPAGEASISDTEYLNSSRTAGVLDRLTEGMPHRIVIFDSPPALAASPAAELAKFVGQALVIVRADVTGQGALEDAISLLSGCPNIQLLLNAVNFSPSGRRFGSYYGYGG
jgi:Mrp family chromosome partitioning ATPase